NLGGGGGMYNCRFDRSTFQNQSAVGLALRRASPAADRGVVLDLIDVVTRNVPVAVAIDGHPTALTDALVRMVGLQGSSAALQLGAAGSNTRILIEDSTFAGPVALAGHTSIRLDNARLSGGTCTIAAAPGTTVDITQSAFHNVTTTIDGSAATVTECRFEGGSISGSATAPVTMTACYRGSTTTLGTNVTGSGWLPGPQLGSTQVTPQQLSIGQTVDLAYDLPPGHMGFWLFGLGDDQPTLMSGLRVYINGQTFNIYPGVWRGQGRVPFPVPPINALRGLNLMFQML